MAFVHVSMRADLAVKIIYTHKPQESTCSSREPFKNSSFEMTNLEGFRKYGDNCKGWMRLTCMPTLAF